VSQSPAEIDSRCESRTHSHFVPDGIGDGQDARGLDFFKVIKSLIIQLDSRYQLPLAVRYSEQVAADGNHLSATA
jgi:hypothetical protein